MGTRLPWDIVETTPGTSRVLLDGFEADLAAATDPDAEVRALVGRALASYWAAPLGVVDEPADRVADRRAEDTERALAVARRTGDADLLATALLGRLYACWGPDSLLVRHPLLTELQGLVDEVDDAELRRRSLEWAVVDRFDHGDLDGVRAAIGRFADERGGEATMAERREVLWWANLAMLEGRLDESVALNQEAISATAHLVGTPFSFQNAAITIAIERFLRRDMADVVEAARSIRASSPRVSGNWDAGLCLSLAEAGDLEGAADLFAGLADDDFGAIARDLNWLVASVALGQAAVRLGAPPGSAWLLDRLRPFAHLDATHGAGYASYGPVGRVVGALAAASGADDEAEARLGEVVGSRAPGPWTALALLGRAEVRARHRPESGLADAVAARDALEALGLTGWAADASTLVEALRLGGHGGAGAVLSGRTWRLSHPSGQAELADGVGVRRLLRLLSAPGSTFDVVDLDPGAAARPAAAAEPALDGPARSAYRRRLEALAAKDDGPGLDPDEEAERRLLRTELRGARYATPPGPDVDRARLRVSRSIHRTIARVAAASPALGEHLRASVHTGRRCGDAPGDGTAWSVTPPP